MSNARGKRSQPRWRSSLGGGAPGNARVAASKGDPGRSGASGPAAPRRRRGRWARTRRRHRAGRKPSDETEEQRRPRDGQRGPDLALGGPGQLDREPGTAQRVQVGRRDVPPVGEGVHQLGRPQVHRMRVPPARRGPGSATACQPLLTLSTEDELEGLVGAGDVGAVAVDVRGGRRDGRGRAGLRCGDQGGPRRRRVHRRPRATPGGRVEDELIDVPAGAGGRGAGARRVVPHRRLRRCGGRHPA